MAQVGTPWPCGGGEMAERIRSFDWASTSLGPILRWPQSLKTIVDLMLASPSMTSLVWGPDAILLYNDRFTELLREHRTLALGRSAYETFARARDVFEADIVVGMAGRSVRLLGQPYPVLRQGQLGEAWFDVDYAPVRDETGAVAGVLWSLKETTAQRWAEQALRTSEARHRLLIRGWAQAEWETDAEGVVVADSPSWRAYTGQTLTEWLGYGWLDAIHPDDRVHAERQWREAVAARDLMDAEFRLRAPDGTWRWTNVRAAPVVNASGRVEKWAGVNIDIDARKQAEIALRESEELRRVAITGGRMGTWRSDLNNKLTWGDAAFMELWGFPPSESPRSFTDFTDRMSPQGQTEMAEMVMRAIAVGEEFDGQLAVVSGPTSGRWVRWRGRAESERPWIINGVSFDVTAERLGEERLRESEERFRGLVEGFGQFSWEAEPDGSIVADSPGWRAFTGQCLDEWRGTGWLDAIHVDDRAATESKWRAAVAAGRPVDAEYRLWHAATASWRWSNVRVVPITRHDGTVRKWAGVNIDVNERRMLQARLEVLVNELQHRSRNLLGVVTSMANRTVGRGSSAESFLVRLKALSRAQSLLSQSGSDSVAVEALVRAELAAHADNAPDRIVIDGPAVLLTSQQVQNFALALHELTTNAVKYGALKDETGRLSVTWELIGADGGRHLALNWIETGVAVSPETVTRRGYGRELIEQALAYALGGRTDYAFEPDGVRCRIELPVV
ncbi:PAS domain-containing sensor histidine kinase [Methylorubrum suomiense]|nr:MULTISPECIES: PAS domain-containing protein [Methylobacteriaceae]